VNNLISKTNTTSVERRESFNQHCGIIDQSVVQRTNQGDSGRIVASVNIQVMSKPLKSETTE
jgi:hypothetical protein